MNVVYIHTHDIGRYVQPYGYAVDTPHLQAFAESGMLFRQAFCANPTCSPSRACLMTGQHAHVNGMLGLAHRGFTLNRYEDTLVNYLRQQGWQTALSGIQHIAHQPYASVGQIGYHEVFQNSPGEASNYVRVTEDAEAFLAREHTEPFFLDIGYFPPHRIGEGAFPHSEPVPNPAYVRPPAHLPDTVETRQDYAEFLASAATFDTMVGRVLQSVKANGLDENTLVIITTDHGIAFPGMKCRLTDHGMGVMLMIRGPREFRGGLVSDSMVSHLDIFPTICEFLKLPVPGHVEGQSLLPLSENPATRLHTEIFSEVNVHAAYEPMRAIRTDRWKYIRHWALSDTVILPNCDNSLSKDYLCDRDWASHTPGEEELYDLILDPMELNNLAGCSTSAAVLDDLRSRLASWMQATHDPLLEGQLEISGKIVTPSNAYSPAGKMRESPSTLAGH